MYAKNSSEVEQAMDNLVEISCDVDDFCRFFIPQWGQCCLNSGHRLRRRQGHLYPSEIITILILFHRSHYSAILVLSVWLLPFWCHYAAI